MNTSVNELNLSEDNQQPSDPYAVDSDQPLLPQGSSSTFKLKFHQREHNDTRVIVCGGADKVAKKAATILSAQIIQSPTSSIALSVGATPSGTYQEIARLQKEGVVELDNCTFTLLDEFYAPPSSSLPPSPHFRELQTSFFNLVNTPERSIQRPDPVLPPEQAASKYRDIGLLQKLDLAIIHCGPSGEVGWVNASTPLQYGAHVVTIPTSPDSNTDQSYWKVVTLGPANIFNAKKIILLALNRNKAKIVRRVLSDQKGETFAGWLLHNHPNVQFIIDNFAAKGLRLKSPNPLLTSMSGITIMSESNQIFVDKVVTCFSPHPDDTSISAGATLSLLSDRNCVISCICTTGHRAYIPNTTTAQERIAIRENEAREESELLGIGIEFLRLPLYSRSSQVTDEDIKIIKEFLQTKNVEVIFMPHTGDSHQTHRGCVKAILLALRELLAENQNPARTFEIFMYEGPWSLFTAGGYNFVVSPPSSTFTTKIAAIRAHRSQTGRTPYDRAADSLATLRASLVPEQDLAGFGAEPPQLADKIELFYHVTFSSPLAVDEYLQLVEKARAPTTRK